MTLVFTPRDENRVNVSFPYSRRFIELLRALPAEDRSWHADERCWAVDLRHLPKLAALGARLFGDTDATALHAAQRAVVEEACGAAAAAPACYAALHLLPSAPLPVVKAAYRALARLHHPDHGGSSREMAAITRAYQIIIHRR